MLVLELHHRLDAERVGLRVGARAIVLAQLLREHAVRAIGEDRDPRADLLCGAIVGHVAAVGVEPHLAQAHALDATALDDQLAGAEPAVDLHSLVLGDRGQIAHQPRDRQDHVIAVVHGPRRHELGDLDRAGTEQEEHVVLRHRADALGQEAMLTPAGGQLVERPRVDHGTAEIVIARLRRLVDDRHRDTLAGLVGEPLELDGRGQAARPGPDDEDIERRSHACTSSASVNAGMTVSISPTTPKSA
jgi:hypothetical protein